MPDPKFFTGSGFLAMKFAGSGFSVKCSTDCRKLVTWQTVVTVVTAVTTRVPQVDALNEVRDLQTVLWPTLNQFYSHAPLLVQYVYLWTLDLSRWALFCSYAFMINFVTIDELN